MTAVCTAHAVTSTQDLSEFVVSDKAISQLPCVHQVIRGQSGMHLPKFLLDEIAHTYHSGDCDRCTCDPHNVQCGSYVPVHVRHVRKYDIQ